MTGKTRNGIILSAVIAFLCVAAVAVVLVVFFGKGDGIGGAKDHIIAGGSGGTSVSPAEMDIRLYREHLEYKVINEHGFAQVHNNYDVKDFTSSRENIFGIKSDMIIGPQCYFQAEMAISNEKPYSFEYWLEITPIGGESLLAEQLELTVTVGNEIVIKRTLDSGLSTKAIVTVNKNETSRFIVTLMYLDVDGNDKTKNKTLAFDMIVHAALIQD